ncbi:chemotaxis protein CheX [Caldalkalibacillus mannanilyticus]|uniref:chemotaxis protein CheX n=1 Tax=Caldalkalibacillus mannanilyticus TaxID=1418 RepID=UPI0004688FA4|nr:chemotaxis protein CheX [Caldalkalibacillus mannanilyticus]
MSINEKMTRTLNATVQSIKLVIPLAIELQAPKLIQGKTFSEMGVAIGITGEMSGKILFQGPTQTFSAIGNTMFGMPLEGEMLYSFAGELGNMIAGNLSTIVFQTGTQIDITPPTVLKDADTFPTLIKGIHLETILTNAGKFQILLSIEE